MTRFTPRQPDPYILYQGDQEIAKFGHLNHLLKLINNISGSLPDMTGHAGEFLTTDGVTTSWAAISGGTQNLQQVLAVAPAGDAAGLNVLNVANLTVDYITDWSGSGLLIDDNGGGGAGVTISPIGPLTLSASADNIIMTAGGFLDATGVNSVNVPAGTALNPAVMFGDPLDGVGLYRVSAVQGGATVGNTLTWGWDANGLFTGTITEQVGAAGVTIAGTGGLKTDLLSESVAGNGVTVNGFGLLVNDIFDNSDDINIHQTAVGKDLILTTDDGFISLHANNGNLTLGTAAGSISIDPATNNNLDLSVDGTGVITMNGAPTYTGTLAGAAGLNVVNGLIIA